MPIVGNGANEWMVVGHGKEKLLIFFPPVLYVTASSCDSLKVRQALQNGIKPLMLRAEVARRVATCNLRYWLLLRHEWHADDVIDDSFDFITLQLQGPHVSNPCRSVNS